MTTKISGTEGVDLIKDGTVKQADLAANVVGNGPAFYAWQNVAQSIPSQVLTKINLQAERFDTNNAFDTTLSRFQPQVAGYYQFTGGIGNTLATNNQSSQAILIKNGGAVAEVVGPIAIGDSFNASQCSIAGLVYLNGTTDYVELFIFATAACNASAVAQHTFFSGVLVRAA